MIRIRMPLLFGHQAQNIESKAKRAGSGIGLSTRLALAMVSLVVVTTGVLSLVTYHYVTEAAVPRALDRLSTKALLTATKLEAALNVARQDVMVIQGSTGAMQMGVARSQTPFARGPERASLRGFWQCCPRNPNMPSCALSASLMAGANCYVSTAEGRAVHPASCPK